MIPTHTPDMWKEPDWINQLLQANSASIRLLHLVEVMPAFRERPQSRKVRENERTAALLQASRGPSPPGAPRRSPSRHLDTQDLLNRAQRMGLEALK